MEPPLTPHNPPAPAASPQEAQIELAGEERPAVVPEQSRRAGSHHTPVWAQRVLLGLEVGISVWTGILVLVLPWTRLWTENPLLLTVPSLKLVLNFTFIRGMISGLGLVDIWMGLADALHYRDLR